MILPEVWKFEVCAGFDPTMAAQALHERGMLERPERERGYQKQQWIAGLDRTHRTYTVKASIFSGSYNDTVGSVGSVGSACKQGTSDDIPKSENGSNINALPTLPTLPTKTDTESSSEPNPDDWSFNTEDDGLEIPDCLKQSQP